MRSFWIAIKYEGGLGLTQKGTKDTTLHTERKLNGLQLIIPSVLAKKPKQCLEAIPQSDLECLGGVGNAAGSRT